MNLNDLNDEQRPAALQTEGAVLVTAGAGSGKTRLLTHRIANILSKGVSPDNILCITFTNKAANEMRERLTKLSPNASSMWIMTFHAMCARILRADIHHLGGYSRYFTIYSDTEKERTLKRILADASLDADKYLSKSSRLISEMKSNNLTIDEFAKEYAYLSDIKTICDIMVSYKEELNRCNALDFDDLLTVAYRLLVENKQVLDYYSDKFRYISVDEFQDTNKIQYDIIKLLASKHKNVFIVGDEDQSIYGWRGANVQNIFDFKNDFNATVFKLEQNYRSTKNILNAANSVIKNNSSRLDKKLWTDKPEGEQVIIHCARDEQEEAEYCIFKINQLVKNMGYRYSDIAILMRLNALSRSFEERLMFYNIPYSVYGGFKFFERKEIKDVLAYLTVLVNPKDDDAFLRVLNFPRRGIGDASVATYRGYCRSIAKSMTEVTLELDKHTASLPAALVKKLQPFGQLLHQLKSYSQQNTIEAIIDYVVTQTGIKNLYSDGSEENTSRLLNIGELISSAAQFSQSYTDASMEAYLESVTLMSDLDAYDDQNNTVSIATIHTAKGLEFKVVFLVGLDEGLFPITRADTSTQIEEERRLMYVGITRACEKLFLTRAASRYMYGTRKYFTESRFLSELGNNHVKPTAKVQNSNYSYGYKTGANEVKTQIVPDGIFSKPSASVVLVDPRLQTPGTLVRHKTFGDGKITKVVGSGDMIVAEVAFLSVGRKSLAIKFAPLEVIDG